MGESREDPGELLRAAWLGRVDYDRAWAAQQRLHTDRLAGRAPDSLMLLEHPPTYTLGRRALAEDLVYDESQRAARGIALFNVDRGGRATYHGPGQLVGYPIVALGERYDVLSYLRRLEEALIEVCRGLGVDARRDDEHTGVWVGSNKIAAIGVKITRGTTMHGFALNVTTDLSMFEGIVPCGIEGRWVTSVLAETGVAHPLEEVATRAGREVARALGRRLVWVSSDELIEPAVRSAAGT